MIIDQIDLCFNPIAWWSNIIRASFNGYFVLPTPMPSFCVKASGRWFQDTEWAGCVVWHLKITQTRWKKDQFNLLYVWKSSLMLLRSFKLIIESREKLKRYLSLSLLTTGCIPVLITKPPLIGWLEPIRLHSITLTLSLLQQRYLFFIQQVYFHTCDDACFCIFYLKYSHKDTRLYRHA